MRTIIVVVREIAPETAASLTWCAILGEIDLFVRDRAPKPLNKDGVEGAALAVHTDLDVRRIQQAGIVRAGEMAP